MKERLKLYNTLTRTIAPLELLKEGYVGIYWCGPTVYAPSHLGHVRSALVLDTLVRTLRFQSLQVRCVRNITDVGHLLGDGDTGEDKMNKAARLAQIPPMEVAERYVREYHATLRTLGTLPPNIEPRATGHIPEQIDLIQQILNKKLAYEVNGSVYFDTQRYHTLYGYGKLSGRRPEELITGTRALAGGGEKRSPLDFALWKKAAPDHLMRWPSPWGVGYPGWHLECTAMSATYLGIPFDIHGGGLDLCFPHHECEWAQSEAAYGKPPARYWIHHNLVTLEGKKMSKSDQHFLTLEECISGQNSLLSRPYNPMALRLLMLQAHYRSPLDISDDALQAAQKGYYKLLNGLKTVQELEKKDLPFSKEHDPLFATIEKEIEACTTHLLTDLNTPQLIADLFKLLHYLHKVEQNTLVLPANLWQRLKKTFTTFVQEILGLNQPTNPVQGLLPILLDSYRQARAKKDYAQVDRIRQALSQQGITLQDRRDGTVAWQYAPIGG